MLLATVVDTIHANKANLNLIELRGHDSHRGDRPDIINLCLYSVVMETARVFFEQLKVCNANLINTLV